MMNKVSKEIDELLDDNRLDNYVKLELLLSVKLGLRNASGTLESDLIPNSHRKVTGDIKGNKANLRGIDDGKLVDFREFIHSKSEYKAFIRWVKRLGLKIREHWETKNYSFIYIPSVEAEFKELDKISFPPLRIRRVTKLFGFYSADCCLNTFIDDFTYGLKPELRAAVQLNEIEPDENAYFVRDFFPCRPNCEKAIEIGKRFLEFFDGLGLGDAYRKLLPKNIERVRSYQKLVDHPELNPASPYYRLALKMLELGMYKF